MAVRTQRIGFAVLAAFIAPAGAGCFSPTFERCAVTCGTGGDCPGDQVCLDDNKCHASEGEQLCGSGAGDGGPIDAPIAGGEDGGRPDAAGADAGVDGGTPVTPTAIGDLIITEIHKNPTLAPDPDGEWFEVLNPVDRNRTFDLNGLFISDLDMDGFQIVGRLVVAPGGRLVFGRLADDTQNGGVAVDYAFGDLMVLGNDGDEIVIQNQNVGGNMVTIDAVLYGATFPSTAGRSLSLDPDHEDDLLNDVGANWCDGQEVYNGTDFGSPGEPNPPCGAVTTFLAPRH